MILWLFASKFTIVGAQKELLSLLKKLALTSTEVTFMVKVSEQPNLNATKVIGNLPNLLKTISGSFTVLLGKKEIPAP